MSNADKAAALTVRQIGAINWTGLWTLYLKETRRFIKVWSQTLLGPVVSTLLFIVIFSLALGAGQRTVGEFSFMAFLVPGLIMMTMIQNAFSNSSSSIMIGKIQGNIVDILMPPLSPTELLVGHVAGAVTRGLMCGTFVAMIMIPFMELGVKNLFALIYFSLTANIILALLGIMAGVWAEKFDQMAAVTNFIITPLSFLSGTFYPLDRLPDAWQWVALINPFFYMIDGFRTGFLGQSESNLWIGAVYIFLITAGLWIWALIMLRRGYKIKT